MTFQEYINHSWKIHAKETETVYNSLASAPEMMTTNDDIVPMARLITHICGDHFLQNWEKGIELLTQLKNHPVYKAGTDSEVAIQRSIAILKMSAGQKVDISSFSDSDQTRIYAQASAITIEHKNFDQGQMFFDQALQLSAKLEQSNKSDPALRAMAITTNNVTCALEEKTDRTESQTQFMIQTALANLKYWSLAGNGYDDVNLAEYRLSNTYLQAGQFEKALEFAKKCYFGILEHKLTPFYEFYGLEMMALCHSRLKNSSEVKKYQQLISLVYEKLSADEKKSTEKTFNKVLALTS